MYSSLLSVVCYLISPMKRREWLSALLGGLPLPSTSPFLSQDTGLCRKLLTSLWWKLTMVLLSFFPKPALCTASSFQGLMVAELMGPRLYPVGCGVLLNRQRRCCFTWNMWRKQSLLTGVCLCPPDMSPDKATGELPLGRRAEPPLHISFVKVISYSVVLGSGTRSRGFKLKFWSLLTVVLSASSVSPPIKWGHKWYVTSQDSCDD